MTASEKTLRCCLLMRARGTMDVENIVVEMLEEHIGLKVTRRESFGTDMHNRPRELRLLKEGIAKTSDMPTIILYPPYSNDACTRWSKRHHMLVVRRCYPDGAGNHVVGCMYQGRWWWSNEQGEHDPNVLNDWLAYQRAHCAA